MVKIRTSAAMYGVPAIFALRTCTPAALGAIRIESLGPFHSLGAYQKVVLASRYCRMIARSPANIGRRGPPSGKLPSYERDQGFRNVSRPARQECMFVGRKSPEPRTWRPMFGS